jgi:hypothetical protein
MNKNTNKFIKTSNLFSSYNSNKNEVFENYGPFFYGITCLINPKLVVEIGTCKGYSTIYIAQAIKDCNNGGKMKCFDLWTEDEKKTNFHKKQQGKHLTSTENEIKNTLLENNLENIVDIYLYPYAKVYAIGESLKSKDFFKDIAAGDIVRLSMELMTMIPNPAYEDYLNTLNERPKKYMTAPSQYIPSIDRYKGMKFPISPLNPVPSDDYMYLIPGTFIDCTL